MVRMSSATFLTCTQPFRHLYYNPQIDVKCKWVPLDCIDDVDMFAVRLACACSIFIYF